MKYKYGEFTLNQFEENIYTNIIRINKDMKNTQNYLLMKY